jgi:hypothetical protein
MAMVLAHGVQDNFLPHLDQTVVWWDSSVADFSQNGVLIEASLAEALRIEPGNYLSIKWRMAKTGQNNVLKLRVNGVFVGAGFHLGEQLFMSWPTMQSLIMQNPAVNHLRLYFSTKDQGVIRDTLQTINHKYSGNLGFDKNYSLLIQFGLWAITLIMSSDRLQLGRSSTTPRG